MHMLVSTHALLLLLLLSLLLLLLLLLRKTSNSFSLRMISSTHTDTHGPYRQHTHLWER